MAADRACDQVIYKVIRDPLTPESSKNLLIMRDGDRGENIYDAGRNVLGWVGMDADPTSLEHYCYLE